MALILVLAVGLSVASASAELSCFIGGSRNSTLPDSAAIMTAEEMMEIHARLGNIDRNTYYLPPSFCQKSHKTLIMKDKRAGKEHADKTYSWGGTEPRLTSQKLWTCTDNPQSTHGLRLPDYEIVIYAHQCNCCGTRCNGHSMDGMCNETPEFTHSCYSSGFDKIVDTPELPADAIVVPATAQQFCYKLAHYNTTTDKTFYMWGATNFGSQGKCGNSRRIEAGSRAIQICTCCGPLCNGATMNSVNALEPCLPTTPAPQAININSAANSQTPQATLLLTVVLVKLL